MKVQLIRYHDLGNMNTRLAQSLNKKQGTLPPLGLAYIASSLAQAGHELDIIDAVALCLSQNQVRSRIQAFGPEVVGITSMTPTYRGAPEAAAIAKEFGAITVIGGVHLSIYPKETLADKNFDYGVIGEGEETMVELCEAIEKNGDVDKIQGLVYRDGDDIVVGSARLINDISKLPMPAYHLLPMNKYSSIIGMHPTSTMMGSRGCPYKCGFCFKTPSDKNYRSRSAENIVDEIEFLVENYGVKEIMFYDDIMPQKYAESLSREIIRRNVKIKWQTPQRVNLVTPELLSLMAKAGCHILRFGVEQGDPEMMQLVEKKTTIEQVKRSFRWAKEAGIDTFAYFIIGYINETEQTIKATIDLAIELDPRFVMFTKAVPLPNTPLMAAAVEKSFLPADYWARFTLGEDMKPIPPLVPNADNLVKTAYRKFYLRPSKILSQLLSIRSLKDLKKNIDGFIGVLDFRMREDAFTVIKSDTYTENTSQKPVNP